MKSKRIIEHFGKINRAYDHLTDLTACIRTEKAGVEYSPEERTRVHLARSKLYEAKTEFVAVWEVKIGKAVVHDILIGEWK